MRWSFNTRRRVHSIPGRRRRRNSFVSSFIRMLTSSASLPCSLPTLSFKLHNFYLSTLSKITTLQNCEWFGWTFRNTHTKWWIFNMSTWKLQ
jgi:hypothetical protein